MKFKIPAIRIDNMKRFYKEYLSPFLLQLGAVSEVIFYTILPTIIIVLFSTIDKDSRGNIPSGYYLNGEFLLYSIALLSSAYTTMKLYADNKKTSLVIILIILVSISYAITIKTENIDNDALLWLSIVAFGFSFFYTWRAMSLRNIKQRSFADRDKSASEGIEKGLKF